LAANAHRPLLAGFLELAQGAELEGRVLTIRVPQRQKGISAKIEADRDFIEAELRRLTGRAVTLAVHVTRSPAADKVGDSVARVFGEVEERDG
jgi:hypothetical protein